MRTVRAGRSVEKMEREDPKMDRSTELLNSIWSMQKNLIHFIQKTAADHDLSIPQYTILMRMTYFQEITQKMVGEKTFLPKSTLSQAVDGLVKLGLLQREQLEGNRRETLLKISDQGKLLIDQIHSQEDGIHQLFKNAVGKLTNQQYEKCLQAHMQITAYLEEQGENIK